MADSPSAGRLRILFYCEEKTDANSANYLRTGTSGTVSALLLVCRGLARLGHDVHVFKRGPSGLFDGACYHCTDSPESLVDQLASLPTFDVFVANNYAISAALKLKVNARKLVYWCHNFVDQAPIDAAVKRGALHYIVCVSENQLGAWLPSSSRLRCTAIHNAVDLPALERVPLQLASAPKFMFVGAPRACKGFDDAVRVFLLIQQRIPDATLCVAGSASLHGAAAGGSGHFEPEYERTVLAPLLYTANGSLRTGITLLGNLGRERAWRELASSTALLANPSWTSQPETFGLAAVEAQALQVPVISTFRGGLPETVVHQKTGLLARTRSLKTLADEGFRLATDSTLRSRMGRAGVDHVRANFSEARIAQNWDEQLQRMVRGQLFLRSPYRMLRRKILRKLRLG